MVAEVKCVYYSSYFKTHHHNYVAFGETVGGQESEQAVVTARRTETEVKSE